MVSQQKQKLKQIYEICLANKSWGKPFTLKQFKQVYITRTSSCRILKCAENETAHEKVPKSGRVTILMALKALILSKLGFTTLIWF
jgi:hypothetical protein